MRRSSILNGSPTEDIAGFARAVRVAPCIAVGGTAPVGEAGKTVGIGDAWEQAVRCFEIIGDALLRAGSGWFDVVRTRLTLTDIEERKAVAEVGKNDCRDPEPVETIVGVVRFVNPEWIVEVEVAAVVAGAP